MNSDTLFESNLRSLPLLHRGKVRDNYAIGDDRLLIVASDRLSAFDVVLPDPIPGKGRVLTAISNFWFERTRHIVANHLTGEPLSRHVIESRRERVLLEGRAVVVRRLKPLPVEAVVRGYLIGSGWKDYQRDRPHLRHRAAAGLALAARLPAPIFTPATKAAAGQHDENIYFDRGREDDRRGDRGARPRARARALWLCRRLRAQARHHHRRHEVRVRARCGRAGRADGRGADAGFSRFWPADGYREGISPPSFDKQYVRDYLETLDWDKRPPGPRLAAGRDRRNGREIPRGRAPPDRLNAEGDVTFRLAVGDSPSPLKVPSPSDGRLPSARCARGSPRARRSARPAPAAG